MKQINKKFNEQSGISLIEMVIYLGITVAVISVTGILLVRSIKSQSSSMTYKELEQTNQSVLEKIEYKIRHAQDTEVISPTLLKLTSKDYDSNENKYTFFKHENNTIYQADSNNDKIAQLDWENITPSDVKIEKFNFEKINDSIKVDLKTKKGKSSKEISSTYYPRQPKAFCGDGIINQLSEECDDGNKNNNDNCSNSCLINKENPVSVKTCSGEGELFLYDRQGGSMDISFIVQRTQLLIFSRSEADIHAKINGETKALHEEINNTDGFGVKVMSLDTQPGDKIEISGSYHNNAESEFGKGARGVQAFLSQDINDPVYNLNDIDVVYDGEKTDKMKLKKGKYSYILFDRYTYYDNGSPDYRRTSVNISEQNSTIVDKDYTEPLPNDKEGVIVDYYSVDKDSVYTMSIDTEDSMYWFSSICPQ